MLVNIMTDLCVMIIALVVMEQFFYNFDTLIK